MQNRRSFLKQAGLAACLPFLPPVAGQIEAIAGGRNLSIIAVEPYVLKGNRCFVVVRTSEGVTGIGEVSPMNSPATAHLIKNTFEPLLKGQNALDIDRCWERIYYRTYKQGVMGLQPEALSGIDIALWDILGKVAGLPIHQLLGGKRRDSVRVYASMGGGSTTPITEVVRRAEEAVHKGFTAFKIRMDHGPVPPDANVKRDLELIRALRSAVGPDIELGFDPNNGYTAATAIRVGRTLEDLGFAWFEEPVAQTDYAGYRQVVNALDIPIAAGEHEYTRWQFRDLIEQANPDIVQPDLVKCAGISEAVRIAALASAHHKILIPHQTQPTIGQAANLHYTSVFVGGDTVQELSHDAQESPLHELFEEPLVFEKGRMRVPEGAGLGLVLNEQKLRGMLA